MPENRPSRAPDRGSWAKARPAVNTLEERIVSARIDRGGGLEVKGHSLSTDRSHGAPTAPAVRAPERLSPLVPTYTVVGVWGSTARARMLRILSTLRGLQLLPPSLLLKSFV